MKRNVKWLALVLVVAQLLMLLCACGAKQTSAQSAAADQSAAEEAPGSAAAEPTAETAPEPEEADPAEEASADETPEVAYFPLAERKTISVWMIAGMALSEIAESPDDTYGGQYLENLLNVDIEYTVSRFQTTTEDLQLMLASGDYTDIINSLASNYSGGATAAYEEDIILRLNDIVADYMPNYQKTLEKYEDAKKMAYDDDGNMFSVVGCNEEGFPSTFGAIIREDWLQELNMDYPETYDDYYNFLTAIKNQYGCSAPLLFSTDANNQNGTIDYNMLGAGYDVAYSVNLRRGYTPFYAIDGKVTYGPLEPGFKDFMTMMQKWYSEGLFNVDFMSQDAEMAQRLITTDNTGIWYSFSSRLEYFNGMADNPNFSTCAIPDAVKEKGDINHLSATPVSLSEANGACITTACEDVELAARLLDWGFSDEGYMAINWGEEGYTYNLDANGNPVYTDIMLNDPNQWTLDQTQAWYLAGNGWLPGVSDWKNKHPGYSQKQIDSSDIWSVHDNSWFFTTLVSMTADESKEYTALYSDIATYYQEGYMAFLIGGKSMDEFDSWVEEIYNMGIERCIEIWQAALDRYQMRGQ